MDITEEWDCLDRGRLVPDNPRAEKSMVSHTRHDEFEVLKQLRQSQQIFDRLRGSSGSELQIQRRLRGEFPDEVVRAAVTVAQLRKRAAGKFSRADQMWLDRKGLEQATCEPVARYKARRFHGDVRDYCCGIGGDSIALAEHCRVLAFDINPAACLRMKWNAQVYGVESHVHVACAPVESLLPGGQLVHVDCDRRPGIKGRVTRIEDCSPSLDFLLQMMQEFPGGAIKLSPAAPFGGKFPGTEIELISLAGECKEATVWFGELAGEAPFRATVLPSGDTLAGHPLDALAEVTGLGRYIYDPDPAVVRAGLVDLLSEQENLQRLDDAEEYLTSDTLIESSFVRPFEVLASLPNNQREIRQYFRKGDFGQVEIKCRHIPIQADAIRRKLPLKGKQPIVLIFARIAGKARAVVCRRIDSR